MEKAHLRIARPTDDMEELIEFYQDGPGFEIIGFFKDHLGFDGVMLSHASLSYHLEFTYHRGNAVGRAPTEENLLVFYLPNIAKWQQAIDRLIKQGCTLVRSYNPHWARQGKTFEDPDGYRVVLQNAAWP